MLRFAIGFALLCAPAYAGDWDNYHKTIDLGEAGGPQEVKISCRWGKTLVLNTFKEGPGAILTCEKNGPGIRVNTNRQ